MRQNPYEMGRNAAMKALALLEGRSLEQPHAILEPKLVLRGSDSRYEGSERGFACRFCNCSLRLAIAEHFVVPC